MEVLVVNAGSSSLKAQILGDDDERLAGGQVERWAEADADAVADLLRGFEGLDAVAAVAHRVVHGGPRFREATRIDDDVEAAIDALTPLAPLHQPRALAGIRAVRRVLPDAPAVACFDTAWHSTIPPAAATYALPREWRERHGLRRYGFHGLSHAHAARRAAALAGRELDGFRAVTCHLGAGASLAASVGGASVDTTMGYTPLEGIVMQTRSGSVDPGLLLWLVTEAGLAPADVSTALEKASGLAGLSGTSGDMRDVLAAREKGSAAAALAVEVWANSLRKGIAAMAASAGGLDALVFTGGIGEHLPEVRAAATEGLGFLGVRIDPERNREVIARDGPISPAGAAPAVLVVTTREDLEMALQARLLLA